MNTQSADRPHRGKGVLITGGGSGIGRATAIAFADSGAEVLVVGRTAAKLAGTAEGRRNIHSLVADITDPTAPERITETATRVLGRIDVLVNNAAITGHNEDLDALDRTLVEKEFATNLFAPIFLTQRALKALEATGGIVVNVGTAGVQGIRGIAGSSVYGAGKVALDFLTRTWALELAPRGVRVVGVAPGVIADTGIHDSAGFSEQEKQDLFRRIARQTPSRRLGSPEEIAWWIVHLTRAEAAYANGAVIAVDGGISVA